MAISYVGGISGVSPGGSSITLSLTSLTGGIDNTARTNDIVLVLYGAANNADLSMDVLTSGYTKISDLYGNDTYDTNGSISYKIMGSTPDTSVVTSTIGSSSYGKVAIAYVFRGIDITTPIDVTTTTSIGTNSGCPTPPAITPVTTGAVIVCAGANSSAAALFTTSELSSFITNVDISAPETSSTGGIGYKTWTSGTFTPAQFGGGDSFYIFSWVAMTLVLRPAAASGPANLKSYNTNLKANIKTINGNPIANCKSLNTNL